MPSRDDDARSTPSPRVHHHWHAPKTVRVGSLRPDHPDPGDLPVPCIKLRGLWMSEAGFEPGTRLTVEVYDGAILLRASDPPVSVALRPLRRRPSRVHPSR